MARSLNGPEPSSPAFPQWLISYFLTTLLAASNLLTMPFCLKPSSHHPQAWSSPGSWGAEASGALSTPQHTQPPGHTSSVALPTSWNSMGPWFCPL